MIKIEIKIKERLNEEFKETTASMCEVEVLEFGKNATEGEKKTAKIIEDRLKVDQKIQFENLCKGKSKDEIVEEFLKVLLH